MMIRGRTGLSCSSQRKQPQISAKRYALTEVSALRKKCDILNTGVKKKKDRKNLNLFYKPHDVLCWSFDLAFVLLAQKQDNIIAVRI